MQLHLSLVLKKLLSLSMQRETAVIAHPHLIENTAIYVTCLKCLLMELKAIIGRMTADKCQRWIKIGQYRKLANNRRL